MDDLLLRKYLRNEASEEELTAVLDWLDESADNRRYLDRIDYVLTLGVLCGPAADRPLRPSAPVWRRTLRWASGIAAGVLVSLGAAHYWANRTLDRCAQEFMSVTAPKGQSMSLTLSDGTLVWLNAGAKLEYPTIFSERKRQVRISGEAMFEVTREEDDRPFVVETFACEAEVLGTKFNIVADAGHSLFSAALLEGRLKIRNLHSDEEPVILSPNDQVSLVDGHLRLDRIADPDDFRWVDGLMNLEELTFEEVVGKLEQYYGVRIVIDCPERIAQRKYHGKIRVSHGIDHAMNLLRMMTSDFTYTHDNETNTIHVKSRR